MKRSRAPHGMLLMEMLFLIGILVIAMLIEAKVFRAAMRATQSAPESTHQHALLDRAIKVMRADTWNAAAVEVPDATTIQIRSKDDTMIVWQLTPAGAQRTEKDNTTAFGFQPALRARSAPGGVALCDAKNPDDAVHLLSQLVVMRGAQ